jgi:IQ calmodulin-binding motif
MFWLRKNWKVFQANLKRTMSVSRKLLECWLFKVKDYQRFKKDLTIIRNKQISFRFMKIRRVHRAALQRAKFENSVAETVLRRYIYLKQKKAALVIQKSIVLANFQQLVRGRIAVKKLLYDEYYNTFWDAILKIIEGRASLQIQSIFRGYFAREKHSYEIEKLADFKLNYRQNQASCKITAFFRGNYVRLRISKLADASIKIQKRYRMRIVRRSFLTLKQAAITIQVY